MTVPRAQKAIGTKIYEYLTPMLFNVLPKVNRNFPHRNAYDYIITDYYTR